MFLTRVPSPEPFRPDAPAVAEAAAGGLVYELRQGHVLVLHVRGEDRWGFPKGHIEPGEPVLAAARREIVEETGLEEIRFEEELAEVNYRFYDPRRGLNVFKTVVYWKVRSGTTAVRLEPTFDEYRWASADEVSKLLKFDTDQRVLEAFRRSTLR
jgi:8-oxo-dGTP pyrophosphatase MutT (NUDIX family)